MLVTTTRGRSPGFSSSLSVLKRSPKVSSWIIRSLASASHATGQNTDTYDYRVKPGDSLWRIAETHGPDGQDVRANVATIERNNEHDGAGLQAGQVLEIPVISDS